MIGKVEIIDNMNQIMEAEKESLPIPVNKLSYKSFLFDIKDVDVAYLNAGNKISLMIRGEWFNIEFNELIWHKLINKFE